MTLGRFSIICLMFAIRGEALTFSRNGRYIPNVKIAQEIDISDVTFTTPPTTDSDHLASLTNPKIIRAKPRVIVPVVTYHKANHPSQEILGLHGGASIQYDKRNYGVYGPELYKNPKLKKWKIVPLTTTGVLAGHHGKVYLKPAKYRLTYPQRAARPIYYLLGDDPAPTANTEGDYDSGYTKTGSYSESVKLYNEKDLQFVKPNKNQYPKKYSPPAKSNAKPEGYSYDEDETLTPENSETSQMVGITSDDKLSKGGDRVEFQMYGMDGPNSYKFGYDTGKGDNRHFRFEERDSEGKIRGHYGYMDNEGKMRIMKYEADPETGFHAGPVDYSPEEETN